MHTGCYMKACIFLFPHWWFFWIHICCWWKSAWIQSFFLVRIFPCLGWIWRFEEKISLFSPNTGKDKPEKTINLGTFHALAIAKILPDFLETVILELYCAKCIRVQVTNATNRFNESPGNQNYQMILIWLYRCVKSVCIRSYFGPYFPAFGLNTKRYGVSLRIQSECGKIRTRITLSTDTFYAVLTVFIRKFDHRYLKQS